MALTKEQFFKTAARLQTATVDVPELGAVTVRELNTAQRGQLEANMQSDENATLASIRPWVVSMSVMNGEGLMFTAADIPTIGELPSSVTSPIFDRVIELSGYSAADRADLEKNSETSR